MDLHERFMKRYTTEAKYYLLTAHVNLSTLNGLFNVFNTVVKNLNYAYCNAHPILETLRSIMCFFYQQKCNPNLHESETQKLNALRVSYPRSKLNVVKIQKNVYTHFDNNKVKVFIVLDILFLHMLVFCTETTIWQYVEELQDLIHLHLVQENDIKPLDVKLMDCYMDTLFLHRKNSKSTDKLKGEKASALFLKNVQMWTRLNSCKNCQLLTLIVPKLIKLTAGHEFLTKIWKIILNLKNDPGNMLSTLFATADIWFPTEPEYDQQLIDLAMEEPFWLLLLNGLSSLVTSQRKHAVHLLKRVADFADRYETLDLELDNYREITPLVNTGSNSQYHAFKKNCINFFMVLEDLEAKLQNSVTSVVPLFEALIDTFVPENLGSGSHIAWIRCACTRILQHDDNAIVKWGLLKVLTLSLELYNDEFLRVVLDVLNNISLYENHSNEEEPIVVRELIKLLNNAETKNRDLVTRFVVKASKMKWCPVALFYVTHALSMVKKGGTIWKGVELEAVKSLAEIVATVHCQILRIGSQIELLEAITHFATESLDLMAITNTLSAFSMGEVLIRGQLAWKQMSTWLPNIVKRNEALSFLQNGCTQMMNEYSQDNLSVKSFSLIIMLLHDGHLILNSKSCPGFTMLRNLVHCLIQTDFKPHANAALRYRSIELISHLLEFTSPEDCVLSEFISDYADASLRFVFKNLRKACDETSLDNINTCVMVTQQLFNAECATILKREIFDHKERFEIETLHIIEDEEYSSRIQRLFGIKILYVCLKARKTDLRNYKFIGPLHKTYKTESCADAEQADDISDENGNLKDGILIEYWKCVALLFYEYVRDEPSDKWILTIDWIDVVLYLIQAGGKVVCTSLVGILSEIFHKKAITATNMDNFQTAMRLCWKSALESNECLSAVEEMMNLIFSLAFLELRETRQLAIECTNDMLRKIAEIPEPGIILVKGINQAEQQYLSNYYAAVLACLLHGTDPPVNERVHLQARSYILDCYQEAYPNALSHRNANDRAATRAHAIMLLHKIIIRDPTHTIKLLPLIVAKLDESRNEQIIGDSQRHYLENRIMQVLLVLQPILQHDDSERLCSMICNNMLSKSSQPSIRILQEWLLIRIYLQSETLRAKIWDLFDQGRRKNVGSLSSVVSIVYHVARLLSADLQLDFINLAFQYIMPCCMAQQPTVCSYAQVIVSKLYDLAAELFFSTVTEKYREVYIAIIKNMNYENLLKNKSEDDFYLTVFNPFEDYSLQTLFYELPRLSNVSSDERIPPKIFEKFGFEVSDGHPLKLWNMKKAQASAHMVKSSENPEPAVDNISSSVDSSDDIQKRLIPWKRISPGRDKVSEISETSASRRKTLTKRNDIILVSSLVDRLPNLEGISKTCKMLGVEEFVMSSISYPKDKEFQSFSNSVEKLFSLVEVKPEQLQQYLVEKKTMGYRLVGAESVGNNNMNLIDIEFERKTVLLLGNERTGIPANLMPLLHECLEIP